MTDAAIDPIALQKGEGEAFWFLGQLVTIKASAETSGGGLTLIEAVAGQGPGAPLHVHHNDNEWFFVLEGEMAFWVGGTTIEAPAGSFVYGPREIPHTFDVTSSQARFLLGTNPAGFESFVRMVGEPAKDADAAAPSGRAARHARTGRGRGAGRHRDPRAAGLSLTGGGFPEPRHASEVARSGSVRDSHPRAPARDGLRSARLFARLFRASACACMRLCASEPQLAQDAEKPAVAGLSSQWERLDSNQRRHTPTGLQPVPFSLSGTLPARAAAGATAG